MFDTTPDCAGIQVSNSNIIIASSIAKLRSAGPVTDCARIHVSNPDAGNTEAVYV